MFRKILDYIEEQMIQPTYVYVPKRILFFLCLSLCALWALAAALWHGILVIFSVFLLLMSIFWCIWVYRFWRIYYSPITFALILCIGAGLIFAIRFLEGG